MRIFHIAVILVCLLPGQQSYSQEISVTARFDTAAMLIGDHVGLKLQFSGPANSQVIWPVFKDTILGNIIIIGRSKVDSSFSKDKKSVSFTQELNLTCFDSGFYTIPQIGFRYRVLPDTSVKTTGTGLSTLIVHTVKVDTTLAIKAIKGPLRVPITFLEVLPYILLVFAIIILVLSLVWYLRKRKKNEPLIRIRQKAKLQPHEKALQDLEKLRIKELWQQGHVKEYYSELTDILRTYIEEAFDIPALESTTFEIIEEMNRRNKLSKPLIEKLDQMLQTADMVKFAKGIPQNQENERVLEAGIEVVRETIVPAVTKTVTEEMNRISQQTQS